MTIQNAKDSNFPSSKQPPLTGEPRERVRPNEQRGEAAHDALLHALRYAAEGVPITPLRRPNTPKYQNGKPALDKDGKPVLFKGKEPFTPDWQKTASCDPAVIQRWAREYPGCGFGLAMGHEYRDGRRLIALDIEDLSLLPKLPKLPPTRTHATPGNGIHPILTVPANFEVPNHTSVNGLPLDIRYRNAQVVCPGTRACSKRAADPNIPGPYTVRHDLPFAPLPEEWIAFLTRPQPKPQRGERVPQGQQDDALIRLMGKLRRENKGLAEMHERWWAEVATYDFNPADPFTEADFERHLRQAMKWTPHSEAPKADGSPPEENTLTRMAREWWYDVSAERMVRSLSSEPVHYTLGKLESNIITPHAPRLTQQGFHAAETKAGLMGEGRDALAASRVFFKSPLRRDYYGECYVPNGAREVWDPIIGGFRLNMYRPAGIVPAKGDVSLFLEYIACLIEKPEEQKMALRWWAHIVRHPDEPLDHLLLAWSRKDRRHIGKSLLGKIMALLIGPTNVALVGDKDLDGNFDEYLHHTVLIRAEEITQGTKNNAEERFNMLKRLVGENSGAPNRKFLREPMQAIFSNIYMTSNNPNALRIDKEEWRVLVIEAGTGKEQFSKAQFEALIDRINSKEGQAALLHYFLHEVDMEGFNAHQGAQLTEARCAMAEAGRDPLQVVLDALSTEQGRETLYAQIARKLAPGALPHVKCPILTPSEVAMILNTALELEYRDRFSSIRVGVILGRQGKRKRGPNQVRLSKEVRETLWEVDEEGGAQIPDHALGATFSQFRHGGGV